MNDLFFYKIVLKRILKVYDFSFKFHKNNKCIIYLLTSYTKIAEAIALLSIIF